MNSEYHTVKWTKSISFKLPILFILSFLIILLSVMSVVYFRARNYLIDEYTKLGEGVTSLMQTEVDPDRVDEYIEKNFALEDYNRILDKFYTLKKSYPNILYMYVYRIKPEGADVVFDLNSEYGEDANAPGDVYELDKSFVEHIDDLVVGNYVPPLIDAHTPDGYLFTYCRPVFKSDGKYSCHVCVDFSMDILRLKGISFTIQIAILLGIAIILVLLADIFIIRRVITVPIRKLYTVLGRFKYEKDSDYKDNIRTLESVNINTGDELATLHNALVSVMRDSYSYMKNLKKAKRDIRQKEEIIGEISKTAYEDALTGVGNSAAYDKAIEILRKEFSEGAEEFAVLVCDINDLKYINDTFGHEKGNNYITDCVQTIRSVYTDSPIFRVGGDEFIVILKGEDYLSRREKHRQLSEAFDKARSGEDKQPWERYSMSIGMDEIKDGDESIDNVLWRADEKMYENKRKYKEIHGSYR